MIKNILEQVTDDRWILFTIGQDPVTIHARHLEIGADTMIKPGCRIGTPEKPLESFICGEGCRFFGGQIAPRKFKCGDYVTIHDGVWCYGRNDAILGHNCWFGMRCTLDVEGEFEIGDNFGAGQDTHLWSHIRFGDVLQGCKYLDFRKFSAETDVWFVGRCTASPIHCKSFSMALVESNVTKDMESNHVYGGNPAKDLTDKLGPPYAPKPLCDRWDMFHSVTNAFINQSGADLDMAYNMSKLFNVNSRTYRKADDPASIIMQRAFMRFLLPTYKFTPETT